jgi:hypothetical protein
VVALLPAEPAPADGDPVPLDVGAATAPPPLAGVAWVAPAVPFVHCVGPCLSQAGGIGAVSASRFGLVGEKVGLLQLWTLMF